MMQWTRLVGTIILTYLLIVQEVDSVTIRVNRRRSEDDVRAQLVAAADQAQIDRFHALNPNITVHVLDFPDSTNLALQFMIDQFFKKNSSLIDIFVLDVIYTGDVAQYMVDLLPMTTTAQLQTFTAPTLKNDIVDEKLVAMPHGGNFGALYYRKDLLAAYNFTSPPTTWSELENMAQVILAGEAINQPLLNGYLFQASPYEGLTCNAMEWIASHGGGEVIELDPADNTTVRITINNPNAIRAIERVRRWLALGISPQSVLSMNESPSQTAFKNGQGIFLRTWITGTTIFPGSAVEGRVGVTYLPGENSTADSRATIGGDGYGVTLSSLNVGPAVQFVQFMATLDEQVHQAKAKGTLPVSAADLFNSSQLCPNRTGPTLCDVGSPKLVARPSTLSAPNYAAVTTALFTSLSLILGTPSMDIHSAFNDLECTLSSITGIIVERCQTIDRMELRSRYSTAIPLAISCFLVAVIVCAIVPAVIVFRLNRVLLHSGIGFLLTTLFGLVLVILAVLVANTQTVLTNLHCYLRVAFLNIGFTLVFSALFTKSYLFHKVFNNPVLSRLAVSVNTLYMVQALMVCFDGIIIILWFNRSPFQLTGTDAYTSLAGAKKQVCPNKYNSAFSAILLVSKGIVLVSGSYITYQVRNIPSSYNELVPIGLTTYHTTFAAGLCLVLTLGLSSSFSHADTLNLENAFILLGATVALVLLFGSKAVMIRKLKLDQGKNAAASLNASFAKSSTGSLIGATGAKSSNGQSSGIRSSPTNVSTARICEDLQQSRTQLMELLRQTASAQNIVEMRKQAVDTQLKQIGDLLEEYQYHLALDTLKTKTGSSSSSPAFDVRAYVSSLTPNFIIASDRVMMDSAGDDASNSKPGGTALAKPSTAPTKDVGHHPSNAVKPLPTAKTATPNKSPAAAPSAVPRFSARPSLTNTNADAKENGATDVTRTSVSLTTAPASTTVTTTLPDGHSSFSTANPSPPPLTIPSDSPTLIPIIAVHTAPSTDLLYTPPIAPYSPSVSTTTNVSSSPLMSPLALPSPAPSSASSSIPPILSTIPTTAVFAAAPPIRSFAGVVTAIKSPSNESAKAFAQRLRSQIRAVRETKLDSLVTSAPTATSPGMESTSSSTIHPSMIQLQPFLTTSSTASTASFVGEELANTDSSS